MSFPGPGFLMSSKSRPQPQQPSPQKMVTPLLQQAEVLTVIRVMASVSPDTSLSLDAPTPPAATMGWQSSPGSNASPNLHSGVLKYLVKNGAVDVLLVDEGIGHQHGGTLTLKSNEGGELLRLVSQGTAQIMNLFHPSGETMGSLTAEIKVKKDKEDKNKDKDDKHKEKGEKHADKGEKHKEKDEKHKEKDEKHKEKDDKHKEKDDKQKEKVDKLKEKDEKHKKDKDEKKSKHDDQDKIETAKDSLKRQYVLRNSSGQEIMVISLKSKDLKMAMKVKPLLRKGEICIVDSVGGTFQIKFKPSSVTVQNERLLAVSAVIGIVDMEQSPKTLDSALGGIAIGGH